MSVRDGRALRTKTIWNNKDPVFNLVLSFGVDDPEHQSSTAMVKDDDMHAFAKVVSAAAHQDSGTFLKGVVIQESHIRGAVRPAMCQQDVVHAPVEVDSANKSDSSAPLEDIAT